MIFKFRDGFRHRGLNAQDVGEELERIQINAGGLLRPDVVIAVAKEDDSPLHDAFEWDDRTAAVEFRREQARTLIRGICVIQDDHPAVRRFVHVKLKQTTDSGKEDSAYLTLETALGDEQYRQQILGEAKSQLEAFRRKYKTLEELSAVIEAIDHLVPEPEAVAV